MMNRQRQFWLLQTGAWTAYGLESFLSEIGYGRPLDMWRLNAYDALCGFLLTLGIRAVLKATWTHAPAQRVRWGIGALVVASIVGGYLWWIAVSNMCAECKPPKSWLGWKTKWLANRMPTTRPKLRPRRLLRRWRLLTRRRVPPPKLWRNCEPAAPRP